MHFKMCQISCASSRRTVVTKKPFDLVIYRNPDESSYPTNFDEEVAQQATTTFDWMSFIEDGGVRQEKARKCVKDMRTILDNRRLVCITRVSEHLEMIR